MLRFHQVQNADRYRGCSRRERRERGGGDWVIRYPTLLLRFHQVQIPDGYRECSRKGAEARRKELSCSVSDFIASASSESYSRLNQPKALPTTNCSQGGHPTTYRISFASSRLCEIQHRPYRDIFSRRVSMSSLFGQLLWALGYQHLQG